MLYTLLHTVTMRCSGYAQQAAPAVPTSDPYKIHVAAVATSEVVLHAIA